MFSWARACGVGLLCTGFLLASLAFSAGSLDTTFQPAKSISDRAATALLLQRDGRIVVSRRSYWENEDATIVRLRADGSEETTFGYPGSSLRLRDVVELLEQPDGKILLYGYFVSPDEQWGEWQFVRVNSDGTPDHSFPSLTLSNRTLNLLVTSNGLLGIGQEYQDYTNSFGYVQRLRFDGSADLEFPELRLTNVNVASALVVTTNIYLVCSRNLETSPEIVVVVLNTNGTRMKEIQPAVPTNFLFWKIIPQSDGKFIALGWFYGENDDGHNGILRFNQDFTVDSTFQPIIRTGRFMSVAVDAQDRVVIAGSFCETNRCVPGVMRFNSDGALDETFQSPPIQGEISQMALQADDRVLIAGDFTIQTNITIAHLARLNAEPAPLPSVNLSTTQYVVSENASEVSVTFIRSSADGAVSFDFWTSDDTALGGHHYDAMIGRLRFAAGESVVRIPIFNDQIVNGSRSFSIGLSNVFGAELGSNATATIVIVDDEVTNRVQFSATYFPVKETESNALVEVVRDFGSPGVVRVAYRTRDGTALAGRDYLPVTGALDFAAGQFTNSFVVPILNTPDADGNRYAGLELSDPQNGAVLSGQTNATLAILDEESPAIVVSPTEAFLRAAMIGGGTVRFATDGVVHFSSDILLEEDTTIEANGHGVVLSGEGTARHLTIGSNAHVTLDGLIFMDGRSTNGGAIYNEGTLELRACVFSNNVAAGWSGAPGLQGTNGLPDTNNVWLGTPAGDGGNAESGQAAAGGAIFNQGDLTAINSSFLANSALGGDGGAGGKGGDAIGLTPPGKGGNGGNAGPARGGAILTLGSARFSGCRFIANAALAGSAGEYGSSGSNSENSYGQDQVSGEAGLAADAGGGAISSTKYVQLLGCQFESNLVAAADGGNGASGVSSGSQIWSGSGSPGRAGRNGGSASGGALSSSGFAVLSSNVWTGNAAVGGQGGLGGHGGHARSCCGSTYLGGAGANGGNGGTASGGAIAGHGSLSLYRELFLANHVESGSGANGGNGGQSAGFGQNPVAGNGGAGGNAEGGAIAHRGSFIATRAKATGNSANAGTGGRAANPGTGNSGIYVSAGAPGLPGAVGHAFGGALFVEGDSALTECEFTFNSAEGGAGIDGWSSPYYRLRFDGPDGGHGVGGGPAFGGGAHLTGTTILQRSTIASNILVGGAGGRGGTGVNSLYEASRGGVGGMGGNTVGGGIFLSGAAHITNATIAFNECRPGHGGDGGSGDYHQYSPAASIDPTQPGGNAGAVVGAGLAIGPESSAAIAFSTLASNRFLSATGGVGAAVNTWFKAPDGSNTVVLGTGVAGDGFVTLRACIVVADPSAPQLGTNVADGGFNLSSDPEGSLDHSSSFVGSNPHVGPLRDNGGPTPTMALFSGSPAIDAGDDATCPPTDQRGVSRPFGSHCDIGAFELNERTFSISGRVKAHGAVAGIVVSVGRASAMTDSSGLYTLQNLIGDRYEVRPHGAGRFSPARRIVTVGPDARQINFTAHLPRLRATPIDNRGTVMLHLTDLADDGYVLETSTNLVDWTEVEAISADREGRAVVKQMVNTNDARRYFRLGERIPRTIPALSP